MGLPDPLRPPRAAPRRCSSQAARYSFRVLLVPYWNKIFAQDIERTQTRTKAEATCADMWETYTALGYQITELPRADIATRADLVCTQQVN